MSSTPHKEKLLAAINNPKSNGDVDILKEALAAYETWISKTNALTSLGETRDSLVLKQSAVLRLNFCAKNPPLRQAANRYRKCQSTASNDLKIS